MYTLTEDQARDLATALGVSRFESKSYDAKRNTQLNLSGRSFWASDETLRYFSCRIASSRIFHDGVFLVTLYSQASGPSSSDGREWNFIVHDMTGSSIHRGVDTAKKTRKAAENAMWAFMETFCPIAHYQDVVASETARAARRIAALAELNLKGEELAS